MSDDDTVTEWAYLYMGSDVRIGKLACNLLSLALSGRSQKDGQSKQLAFLRLVNWGQPPTTQR